MSEESNYIKHAKRELKALGYKLDETEDGPNKWIVQNIFELLGVFEKQGHSGHSAPYVLSLFNKIANFEPVIPLQGTDDEWMEFSDEYSQNIRCPHVFKRHGEAYDAEGKIFRLPNGSCYTSSGSHVPITFPYTPKREYVDVEE